MKHIKSAFFLGLVSCLAASTGTAQLVLDQQPTRKFALKTHVGVEAIAENFVVSDPAGALIQTITIWGTWTPNALATNDTFDVIFHDNAAGGPPFFNDYPGATLRTYSGISPVVVATGQTMPASAGPVNAEYQLTLALPTPMDLAPGTYWVELYSTGSSGSGEEFEWGMAGVDPVAGLGCVSWSTSTPGVTWSSCTPFPEKEMAIQISAGPPLPLYGGPSQVSLSAGGTQSLALFADAANAGLTYLLLGSVTGTTPGFPIDGLNLPLNPDVYFFYTLTTPNAPPLSGSLGVLDVNGQASASIAIPSGSPASHAGVKLWHAYLVVNVSPVIYVTFVSNAVELELIP